MIKSKFKIKSFESCKIEKFSSKNIGELFYKNYHYDNLPKQGGIYCFFIGKKHINFKLDSYIIKGNGDTEVEIEFNKEWLDKANHKNQICLYVGKSTNIYKRIIGHLRFGVKDLWENIEENELKKPNTVSQLRIGIERIMKSQKKQNQIDYIKKNIELKWFVLNGYENSVNRFYLEDFFIGKYFPLFNVDIER